MSVRYIIFKQSPLTVDISSQTKVPSVTKSFRPIQKLALLQRSLNLINQKAFVLMIVIQSVIKMGPSPIQIKGFFIFFVVSYNLKDLRWRMKLSAGF